MEKFNRAERRAQVARLKNNRKFYYRGDYDTETIGAFNRLVPLTLRRLGMAVQYPANCSCTMCGNSRRHFGERTIQELRWYQDVGEYSDLGRDYNRAAQDRQHLGCGEREDQGLGEEAREEQEAE